MGQGQASVPAEVRQGRFLALPLSALAARRAAAAHAMEELLAPLVDVKVDVLPLLASLAAPLLPAGAREPEREILVVPKKEVRPRRPPFGLAACLYVLFSPWGDASSRGCTARSQRTPAAVAGGRRGVAAEVPG